MSKFEEVEQIWVREGAYIEFMLQLCIKEVKYSEGDNNWIYIKVLIPSRIEGTFFFLKIKLLLLERQLCREEERRFTPQVATMTGAEPF